MKSKNRLPHAATVFFWLTVVVALFSWIGSIYGVGEVQSLLSPEGIRWELRYAIGNFVQAPALGIVMVLFLGLGIAVHSGILDTLARFVKKGKSISHKERRALILAGCTLFVYVLMILCTTFAPWTILRSVTGVLANSPFQKGIYYLISLGIGVSGMFFGYASGRFRDDKDIIRGMSCLFSRFADYFVVLFFIVQFFSSLMYTNLVEWAGIDSYIVVYAFHLCCYLPFVWMLNRKDGF
ncbi:AbgT family transporter [Phocaeicola sp.]|uniref:AbgT family transporter n=1 Tax=Phocaeicola sp. TaxID=2773926 RepID=UPI0023D05DD8|nr:AbgT family transporter [Phocaeicola sp.]MDE5677074.1 AbgT family transporter [Phocaeicola sp.]